MVEQATLEDALDKGIDLGSNAFMLIHGWTAAPLLMEFVAHLLEPLSQQAMTPAQLATASGANPGPLAIALRTCSALGYLAFDPQAGTYAVVQGPELEELHRCLGPSSAATGALRGLYSAAAPPFQVPSEAADLCLAVWAEHRPGWKASKSRALSMILDGVVVAPLLVSITYSERWDEHGKDSGMSSSLTRYDFGTVSPSSRVALADIFAEIGVGTMTPEGVLAVSATGSQALRRVYSYYVPTSYSPMLANFNHILLEDAGWGFDGSDGDTETHVHRTLNVVGSGAQHRTLFKDMMRHINAVFGGENFESQPEVVIDTGCGDGHLLIHIYEHVKEHTPRGRVLSDYPLTMVGVDFNEESRMATAINLSQKDIPSKVFAGDIGKPDKIMELLKRKKVNVKKALHVRSFLDHDRPYIPPVTKVEEDSVVAMYAKAQMADFVHLDKAGNAISPIEVFMSLVEHLQRWGKAVDGSFGLCMLEVMMLDVPTTKHFLNDCVSFHFDVVQCLSRQYMISPQAFAMGGAMAGFLPKDYRNVQTYPEQGKYCRVLNQHLVMRPFLIRFALPSDLPTLSRLEELAWADNLRATQEVLRRRLDTSPMTNLVCELKGEVVAVLYMQRVGNIGAVDNEKFMTISEAHSETGRIVQLIAIAASPEVSGMGIGSELRAFALHLARLDPTIDSVIGVTRCLNFNGSSSSLQEYVDSHVAGRLADPTLNFHTSYGAQVVRLVPDFRPEDTHNQGIGVLIQYQIKDWTARPVQCQVQGKQPVGAATQLSAAAPTLELLSSVMTDLGYPPEADDLGKGFFAYGMDSLELVRVRNQLGALLGRGLSASLLFDYPSVQELAAHLDRERGLGAAAPGKPAWGAATLVAIHRELLTAYALEEHQERFRNLAQRHLPDVGKYQQAIEPIQVEVEGPVLVAHGLVEDDRPSKVRQGRAEMARHIRELGHLAPEALGRLLKEILRVTKQDQN